KLWHQLLQFARRTEDAGRVTTIAAASGSRVAAVERRVAEVTGPAWRWGLAFFGFALMLVALLPPGNVSLDGDSMLQVSRSIVNGHGLKVACGDYTVHGRGGACYSTFYPLQSILAVPMIALGHVV